MMDKSIDHVSGTVAAYNTMRRRKKQKPFRPDATGDPERERERPAGEPVSLHDEHTGSRFDRTV